MSRESVTSVRQILEPLGVENQWELAVRHRDEQGTFLADLAGMLAVAASSVEAAEQNLRNTISSVRASLDNAERDLDKGYHVNRSGILQQTGRDVDRYASEREERVERLVELVHLYKTFTKES